MDTYLLKAAFKTRSALGISVIVATLAANLLIVPVASAVTLSTTAPTAQQFSLNIQTLMKYGLYVLIAGSALAGVGLGASAIFSMLRHDREGWGNTWLKFGAAVGLLGLTVVLAIIESAVFGQANDLSGITNQN